MPYQIAPWIRPAGDLGEDYLGGVRIGAEIAHQQAALAQQANQSSMEMTLKQQQLARESALEQQRMQIQKAYQMQQIGLRNQELKQQAQLNALKVQDAARRFAAQQAYQKDIAGGMPIAESILKRFPGTDESMTGYGQLAHQLELGKRILPPPQVQNIDVNGQQMPYLKIPEAGGGYRMQNIPKPGRDVQSERLATMQIRELERQRDKMESALENDPASSLESRDPATLSASQKLMLNSFHAKRNRVDALDQKIDSLYNGDQSAPPQQAPAPAQPSAEGQPARVRSDFGPIPRQERLNPLTKSRLRNPNPQLRQTQTQPLMCPLHRVTVAANDYSRCSGKGNGRISR